MEEGSLLYEALNRDNELENSLIVDVYLIDDAHSSTGTIEHLLALSNAANQLNDFFQNHQDYPWLSGGDGPVFGVHVSDGIPHVRALCKYGVSVADEWNMVGLILEYTIFESNLTVECWDVDDGQVVLIQSAEALPSWVDLIGPQHCRHRCWIQSGQVQLIQPESVENQNTHSLSLAQALKLLQKRSSLIQAHANVNRVIRETVQRVRESELYHNAALAVPRSVAWLIQNRPDLVSTASQAFVNHADKHPLPKNCTPILGTCEDWVWITHRIGRTQYAMLRTVTAAPHWKMPDTIPSIYQSIEVKRLKRQCMNQATPHLRYGLQLGIRLVAGLDYLLQEQGSLKSPPSMSLIEQRVLKYWSRIAYESHGRPELLTQAWAAGPMQAEHSLDSILNCPVFEEEVKDNLTPLSHPEESLEQQIRRELLRKDHPDKDFAVPGPSDVDDDGWMTMPTDEELLQKTAPLSSTSNGEDKLELDKMLGGVETFMAGKSDVEGVAHEKAEESSTKINPTVFLNILHTVLKAKSPDDFSFAPTTAEDPFFSNKDFDLMQVDDDADNEMIDMMKAMDQELQGTATQSRNVDVDNLDDAEDVAQDAHILSNLLKSLDAGGGAPGPVKNILKEMGVKPPRLESEEDVESEKDS